MAPLPRRFRRDRSGSVAVTAVMALGVTFGMAAITIDASRFYLVKRRQQGITDLAAVAAAANIADAPAAAAASLAANSVPAATLASVELGTYAADPAVAAPQRFTVGGTAPNAARVTLRSAPTAVFGALLGTAVATVGTRSTAVNANVASFALGSTLARVDAGLANAVLGGLTRSTLSLSAADYASLAAARVDLFGVANALAARVGATGTYASLAGATVRVADVIGAAADALTADGTSPSAVVALRAVATAVGSSGPSLAFGSLVAFGAFGTLAVGSPAPAAAALPLLPLVAAAARLGGGTAEVSANLGGSGTAIVAATVKVAIGGPTAGSSYAAIGPVGTTLHTARTRVLLTLQLAQFGAVSGLNLPLYVEVAPATAALSAIGCSAGAPVDPAATLSVTPGAVDAWIGNVSDAMLVDMTVAPSPSAALLTNLVVVSVWGRAHATVSNTGATAVPFARADVAAGTAKTTSTTDVTSSLLSRLFGDLQLGGSVLGANVTLPAGTAAAIGALLQADLQPIDAELSNILAALGLTIGDATTWVRATRCGQGVVVN
ncbi:hypothetical protein D3273_14990 [Lichenibacterium minor]|uniref:DUF2134 domain-containing protein n=1 Tax=Lichenibacterium minor TaxID=2316528 RepID=A0A4Q2U8C0_9HYPH|nr:TadG family pilus assembly protein [Lichenibacterium minor]RYC31196.1 hypothetical protein D3273_14990 [Lichenibacterium minor]